MKHKHFFTFLAMLCIAVGMYGQGLYTQTGSDPSFQSLINDGIIKPGSETTPNIRPASTVNVNNAVVEQRGTYSNYDFDKNISLHTLTSARIDRKDFSKMQRWYQEDGKTQVFRLFKGERNVRNTREGAARIETFSHISFRRGRRWHEWIGTYTIIKPMSCSIFQSRNDDNDWGIMINLTDEGNIIMNHRRHQSDVTIARNMTGKSFDLRIRDNGHDYEVYFNSKKVGSGYYDRPIKKTRFRWGMYNGSKADLSRDAMILVSGARVNPKSIPDPGPDTNRNPVVSFSRPNRNKTVNFGYGRLPVVAVASDPDGSIARVSLYIDDKLIRTETRAPYKWGNRKVAQETKGLSVGKHTFRVVATDNEGATSSDTFILTVTNNKAPDYELEDESGFNSLTLYQEPNSSVVVMVGFPKNAFQTKIYNIQGKEVLSEMIEKGSFSKEINVASLPSGIYIAKVFSEQGSFQSKFIKR